MVSSLPKFMRLKTGQKIFWIRNGIEYSGTVKEVLKTRYSVEFQMNTTLQLTEVSVDEIDILKQAAEAGKPNV